MTMTMETQTTLIVVGIGDVKVGQSPAVIRTTLGSCIAVCLYDQQQKIGGMLHLMMANSEGHTQRDFKPAKFADTGIPLLLEFLKKQYGVLPSQLKAKIFGGAKILRMVSQDIGKDNENAVRQILKTAGIPILAAKTGGEKGYQVDFDLVTARVSCRIFGQEPEEF